MQWEFPIRFVYDGYVLIEADSKEDAIVRFEDLDWDDDIRNELANFEQWGEPRSNE